MAFTTITVTGSYPGCSGILTFTLTNPMQNDGAILVPQPISVELADDGSFSVVLSANDDADTQPQGVTWGVTETIDGAQPRDFFIAVPSAAPGGAALMTDLIPGVNPWR